MKKKRNKLILPFIIIGVLILLTSSCKKDKELPVLQTSSVINITQTTAISGGNVLSDGESTVTTKGVCWSTSQTPTIADPKTTDSSGLGYFTSNLTGLVGNTVYYVRAYATNSTGTAYGNTISFSTLQENSGTVTDIDGNVYTTVKIGTQVWMVENLKTTKYRDGSAIPDVTDKTIWSNLTTGAYCNYNNDTNNSIIYGRLYNWYAISDIRKIAPTGWHVPSQTEWQTLIDYLIGNYYNYDSTATGNKIAKSLADTILWDFSSNIGAIGNIDFPYFRNKSGFSALPSGYCSYHGIFNWLNEYCYWWSSTEFNVTNAQIICLYNTSAAISGHNDKKVVGYSIRCLMD
ncbi:fibrobacter succinogenes major paralogous domain-containing protein [Bacteroidota bacterium]